MQDRLVVKCIGSGISLVFFKKGTKKDTAFFLCVWDKSIF